MSDYWERRFEETGADGVDFTSLLSKPWDIKQVYDSKTREEMLSGVAYPRTNYFFWKLVNGKKVYITEEKDKRKPGSIPCHPEHRQLWAVKDWGEDKIVGIFDDEVTAEEMCIAYTEEAAYEEALELYQWNHHWSMERACHAAWRRHILDFWVEPVDYWSFLPF